MKKVITFILTITLVLTMLPTTARAATTTAIPSDIVGHWAQAQITAWINEGNIKGYTDGTFKPENTVTRAEFMILVNRAYNFTEKATISYTDVASGAWYYDTIAIAQKAGYITGYDDNTMRPNNPIARQEAAVIVCKLNSLKQDSTKAIAFKDSTTIPSWSLGYVGAVAESTFMKGDTEGKFNPIKNLTRAESVVLLDRSSASYVPVATGNIVINLPTTTTMAINLKDQIFRFTTDPAEVTISAEVDTEEFISVAAFSTKLTITSGAKSGYTTLTLTAKKDGYTTTKHVMVIRAVDKDADKAVTADTKNLTESSFALYHTDESIGAVTTSFTLPITGEKGSKISWKSSNEDAIKIEGDRAIVKRQYYTGGNDVTLTLTATIEYNGVSDTKTFAFTVLKAEPSSEVAVTSDVYDVAYNVNKYQILSEKEGVTESLTVENFLSKLEKHPYAEWKVVPSTTKITSVSTFDSASGKSVRTTLTDGDILAIKSEDETKFRVYTIVTMDQVAAPDDFGWTGKGILSWDDVSGEYGYYVDLYKNDELIIENTVKANTISYNYLAEMKANGIGTYYAKIIAKGDMPNEANSISVETDTEQQIKQLSAPGSLSWSGSTAKWSEVSNTENYTVELYKDGVIYKTVTVSGDKESVDLGTYLTNSGIYKFRVTALAVAEDLWIDSVSSEISATISR